MKSDITLAAFPCGPRMGPSCVGNWGQDGLPDWGPVLFCPRLHTGPFWASPHWAQNGLKRAPSSARCAPCWANGRASNGPRLGCGKKIDVPFGLMFIDFFYHGHVICFALITYFMRYMYRYDILFKLTFVHDCTICIV